MKNGTHGNIEIDEISANRILREMFEKAKQDNDGKVHVREIKNGHVGNTLEIF